MPGVPRNACAWHNQFWKQQALRSTLSLKRWGTAPQKRFVRCSKERSAHRQWPIGRGSRLGDSKLPSGRVFVSVRFTSTSAANQCAGCPQKRPPHCSLTNCCSPWCRDSPWNERSFDIFAELPQKTRAISSWGKTPVHRRWYTRLHLENRDNKRSALRHQNRCRASHRYGDCCRVRFRGRIRCPSGIRAKFCIERCTPRRLRRTDSPRPQSLQEESVPTIVQSQGEVRSSPIHINGCDLDHSRCLRANKSLISGLYLAIPKQQCTGRFRF
jgi:hypothetical protein